MWGQGQAALRQTCGTQEAGTRSPKVVQYGGSGTYVIHRVELELSAARLARLRVRVRVRAYGTGERAGVRVPGG